MWTRWCYLPVRCSAQHWKWLMNSAHSGTGAGWAVGRKHNIKCQSDERPPALPSTAPFLCLSSWPFHGSRQGREHTDLLLCLLLGFLSVLQGITQKLPIVKRVTTQTPDWVKLTDFLLDPSDVTELVAGFISLVSHCKLDSCGVAWTSAWFCEFSLPQRKLILKSRSNVYTVNKRPILFSQTWITTTRLFCFLKRKIQPKQANRQNL